MSTCFTRRQGNAGPDDETRPLLPNSIQASRKLWNKGTIDRPSSQWRHPSSIILAVTALERFSLYGIICNLSIFLGQSCNIALNQHEITLIMLLFTQLPYIGAFAAGTLADSRLGRYNVFLSSLIFQFVGSLLILVSAILDYLEEEEEFSTCGTNGSQGVFQGLVFTGLTLLAFGISCSSGTEIPLGVDQYGGGQHRSSDGPEEAAKFFYRYYFVANVASTFSYTLISFVQINYSFVHGLWPSCVSYLAAVILLHAFRHQLVSPKPDVSTLHTALRVIGHALCRPHGSASRLGNVQQETIFAPESKTASNWLDRAAADKGLTERQIRDVRHLGGVMLVLLSLTFYMASTVETMTAFVQQGELMTLPGFNRTHGTYIPSSMFSAFDPMAVLVFIPVLYGYIYPKLIVSDSFSLRQVRRITIGMLVAMTSVLAALLVEIFRCRQQQYSVYDRLSGSNSTVSDMTIYYQIPQYTLAGLAEVLVMVSALEFAYYSSPLSMKGSCTGMVYGISGVGGLLSFVLSILIHAVDMKLYYRPNAQDYGHVHYFYVILLILVLLGLLLFLVTVRYFKRQPQRAA